MERPVGPSTIPSLRDHPVSRDLARRQYEGTLPFHSACPDDQVLTKKGYTFSSLPRFRART
jgi:hypothetical protein